MQDLLKEYLGTLPIVSFESLDEFFESILPLFHIDVYSGPPGLG
jgi:hypothetical protein